jgi:hypothetical protein
MAITIEKACVYLALIVLILFLIYVKSNMDLIEEKEGFETTTIMYGPGMSAEVPVTTVRDIKGTKIYMVEQDGLTKMVSSTGEAKYYKGRLSKFKPFLWLIGRKANYKIKTVTPVPTVPIVPNRSENVIIKAMYVVGNNITFFKGQHYQSIGPNSVSPAMNIDTFPGLTSTFKSGDIDAITFTSIPNITLWFKMKKVMLYDNVKREGNEMDISNYFADLPNDFREGSIDGVVSRGPDTEYVLFKNTRYCIVDMSSNKFILDGNISDKYKTLPAEFLPGNFDCASYSGTPNCAYIMKNDKFVEYNLSNNTIVKGPLDILNTLNMLLPPFLPVSRVCEVYERLMKRFPFNQYWEKMYYTECKRITKKEYETNLNNYRNIVNSYKETYGKEFGDNTKMVLELNKMQKLINDKQQKLKGYKDKLLELETKPCTDDKCDEIPKCKSKSVLVYENGDVNAQQFYQVDKSVLKNCVNDPNIGKQYPGGFNLFKHPKFNEYQATNPGQVQK